MSFEYPIEFDLTTGLAPYEDSPKGLLRCLNMLPKHGNLTMVDAPSYVATVTGAKWPFPQVFRNKSIMETYLCTETAIYLVSYLDGVYSGLTALLTGIPSAGYPWGFAQIGEFLVFTNNKSVVYAEAEQLAVASHRLRYRQFTNLQVQTSGNIPIARDICEVNGQLVVAGPWMYGEHMPKAVAWSRVGSADFRLDQDNIAGNRLINDCGTILRVVPFGPSFIAYGTHGVARFTIADHPEMYTHKKIHSVGLYSQLAVDGDQEIHVFVGTDMNIYSVSVNENSLTPTPETKKVGFDYHLNTTRGEIVVTHNPDEKEFYACF